MASTINADNGVVSGSSGLKSTADTSGQFVDNRPAPEVVTPPAPTKEELLAQVQSLTAQIQALA